MSAGAYTVALELNATGEHQRYVLRGPDGARIAECPVTRANKRWIDQEAANLNRMARDRARKEVSQ